MAKMAVLVVVDEIIQVVLEQVEEDRHQKPLVRQVMPVEMLLKHMVVQAVVVPEEQVVLKNQIQLNLLLVEQDMDLLKYHHHTEHQDHQDH